MIFNRLNVIALIVLWSAQLAHAKPAYTYQDASKDAVKTATAQGIFTLALNKYDQFVTTQIIDRGLAPSALTDGDIQQIMNVVKNSPLRQFGLGQIGGAQLDMSFDETQYGRYLGAKNAKAISNVYGEAGKMEGDVKVALTQSAGGVTGDQTALALADANLPSYESKVVNLKTVGSDENLLAYLTQLKDAQATVRTVTFKGLVPRAGKFVAGTLQVMFVGGAALNSYNAYNYYQKSQTEPADQWTKERCAAVNGELPADCQAPGWLSYLIDSSEAIFYNFHTAQ